ncbi:PepSY domain-containing protein [bacterium]|nr:MAG: PepSY domain-containing protein [bacterium]
MHNVLGFYLYPVLLIVTLTTVHLVAKNVLERRAEAARPVAPRAAGGRGGRIRGPRVIPAGTPLPIDTLVATARAAVPNDELVEVALPSSPEAALRMMVRQPRGLTRYTNVYVDPYRGNVLEITRTFNSEGNSPLVEVSEGLHYGAYGGPFSKAVYTVAGLMPTGLLITGSLMWWRKKRRPRKSARV